MEVFKVSCSLKGEEDIPDVFLLFAQFFQLFPVAAELYTGGS